MGCDIHLFVEVRDNSSAPWLLMRIALPCSWCNATGQSRDGSECYGCKGSTLEPGYRDRNYDTFAILANVRNGSGFAGCDTGDGFIPISEPRGLPGDMCPELKRIAADEVDESLSEQDREAADDRFRAQYGAGWLGDHSHSWLSLRELLACDWTRTTRHRGWPTLGHWIAMREVGKTKPEAYCADASGSSVRAISETVAEALRPCVKFEGTLYDQRLASAEWSTEALSAWRNLTDYPEGDLIMWSRGEKDLSVYVPMQWTDTYAESAGRFHSAFIPALVALGKSPDDVRIVFGFDS